MKVKTILGAIALGLIGAMIATVIVLSLVPVKLAPNFETPVKIVSYKYRSSTPTFSQHTTNATEDKAEFDSLYNTFNNMGKYTIMNQLFSGLSGAKPQLVAASTKSFETLRKEKQTGYWIEFVWSDNYLTDANPTLKNINGTSFYPSGSTNKVQYYSIGLYVEDSTEIKECNIYVRTGTTSTSAKYYYTAFYNTKALYDLADGLEYTGI